MLLIIYSIIVLIKKLNKLRKCHLWIGNLSTFIWKSVSSWRTLQRSFQIILQEWCIWLTWNFIWVYLSHFKLDLFLTYFKKKKQDLLGILKKEDKLGIIKRSESRKPKIFTKHYLLWWLKNPKKQYTIRDHVAIEINRHSY